MEQFDLDQLARVGNTDLLADVEAEVDRLMVGDAIVERSGDHYRIVAGGETWDELDRVATRDRGMCSCGTPLCESDGRPFCRLCDAL